MYVDCAIEVGYLHTKAPHTKTNIPNTTVREEETRLRLQNCTRRGIYVDRQLDTYI